MAWFDYSFSCSVGIVVEVVLAMIVAVVEVVVTPQIQLPLRSILLTNNENIRHIYIGT